MLEHWATPERLGCCAPVAGKDYLVVAFESGFAYFDPATEYLEWLRHIEKDKASTRLNDGRTDRQGRFWAGTMVENGTRAPATGALYCLDRWLGCTSKISGLSISNGLCWSPDSSYMYHTDTPTGRIDRYDFDARTGEIRNRVTFAVTDPGCWPDGSTVDSEGYLWNAQWGGNKVVRYSPAGDIDLVLPVPVSQPTCVAFGGPELNLLFVTSARQGLGPAELDRQQRAGNLFIYKTRVAGLNDSEFAPETENLGV